MEKATTLGQLIPRFISRRNLAPNTQDYYRILLHNLLWYAQNHYWPEDISLITRGHVNDFLDYVASHDHRWPSAARSAYKAAAPATIYHYGKVVKSLFNWAEDEEYLDHDHNPCRRLKLGTAGYRQVEPYTDDEVSALLRLCHDDARLRYRYLGVRNQAIISLFVATGLRIEELSRIRLVDFDPRLQEVAVNGKGGKPRVVPIGGEARKAVKGYLQLRPPGGDELWKTDDGQPMTMAGIKIMLARLKRRARVESGGGAHRFRHYFATRYLEAGGDINSLRLLLGHATLAMVLRYSGYVDVRKVLAERPQFNPLDRLYRRLNYGY